MIYVDAPTFTTNSNGIRCLYYLAKQLAHKGIDTALLPRNFRGFRQQLPTEFADSRVSPLWSIQAPGILICAESVPPNTIQYARSKGIRILWWYLAPHGLLEKPKATPSRGEKVMIFSSYVLPQENIYYFFQPPLDPPWQKALSIYQSRSNIKRLEIGLYCGKGRLRALPDNLMMQLIDSNIHIITRTSPPTRNELFSLLSTLDGLITFDELSQLSLEAVTLGVPVFLANPLFPHNSISEFPIPIKHLITQDASVFDDLIAKRRQGKLKPIQQHTLFTNNSDLVARIASLISSTDWDSSPDDTIRIDNITKFGRKLRSARVLYPHYAGQSAGAFFIEQYVGSISAGPTFYRLSCLLINLMDEIGRYAFLAGGGALFARITNGFKKSKTLRKSYKAMLNLY